MSLTLRDKYNLNPEDEATVKAIIRQGKDPVIPRNPELPIYGRIHQPSYLLWKGEGLERNNIWTLRHLLTAYGITRRDKNGNERSKQEMIDIIRSNPQYLEDMKSPKDARLVNGFPAPERIEMDDDPPNPMAVHPPVNRKKQVKVREIPIPQPEEEEEYDIIQIEESVEDNWRPRRRRLPSNAPKPQEPIPEPPKPPEPIVEEDEVRVGKGFDKSDFAAMEGMYIDEDEEEPLKLNLKKKKKKPTSNIPELFKRRLEEKRSNKS